MSATRVKQTPYQRETENILQTCKSKVIRAYQKYQEDLSSMQDDVKDSIDIILQEKSYS
ncbi:MAG: hypothetical protein R3A45_05060 [Bdellovibrionota bacterium]